MKLVIAEKPSVAKSIAAVLNAEERKDGFFIGNGYIISWCVGHLVGLATADMYDEKYAKWSYEDLPIIPESWEYIVPQSKRKQFKILSRLMNSPDVETVICATDAGREGELIFRLVYNQCRCTKPIERLWISSMEESAILNGFENLKSGVLYEPLYQAALCRMKADWIVGINATRLFSVLYGRTLNIGRVQTPTLAMIVEREKEIMNFVREPFYHVEIDSNGFTASSEKIKEKQTAEKIRIACDGKSATVRTVEKQEKTLNPPRIYDLTTVQREANKLHGYTAQQTLDYAQSLYEKKLITYPRTDSRYLTSDMVTKIPNIVNLSCSMLSFIKEKSAVIPQYVVNDSKVTDHHAIIPTKEIENIDLTSLPTGERNILIMLAVRLICAVSEKHLYAGTVVTLDCEGYEFFTKGKTVIQNGWRAIIQDYSCFLSNKEKSTKTDTELKKVFEGQSLSPSIAALHERFTSPPKAYTEDTLLSAMETAGDMPSNAERKGLGTPATRAGIIEKLVKSKFVVRKDKQLLPTEKAINLIETVPDILKSPSLTAEWEQQLKCIEYSEFSADNFMRGISAMIASIIGTYNTAIPEKLELFKPNTEHKVIGVCPRCGGDICENAKGFFCNNKDCKFAIWKNNRFFLEKRKPITEHIVSTLLTDGQIFLKGLYSAKTGGTYNGVVILDDNGGKYVNFKLKFLNGKKS